MTAYISLFTLVKTTVSVIALLTCYNCASVKQGTHSSHLCCLWSPVHRGLRTTKGYSDEVKRKCLKMYVNGMSFRGIERGHCVCITRR